jgi:hypothetical protein
MYGLVTVIHTERIALVDEFEEVIGLGFEVLAQSGACVGVAFEFGAKFADAEEVGGDFACGAGGDFADQGNVTFA